MSEHQQRVPAAGRVLCPFKGEVNIEVCYPCPRLRKITLNDEPSKQYVYCAEARNLPFDRPASGRQETDTAG